MKRNALTLGFVLLISFSSIFLYSQYKENQQAKNKGVKFTDFTTAELEFATESKELIANYFIFKERMIDIAESMYRTNDFTGENFQALDIAAVKGSIVLDSLSSLDSPSSRIKIYRASLDKFIEYEGLLIENYRESAKNEELAPLEIYESQAEDTNTYLEMYLEKMKTLYDQIKND